MKGQNSLCRIYKVYNFRDAKLCRGFSLLEALLAVMILSMSAASMTALYMAGMKAVEAQQQQSEIDSSCRSRMELLISTKFSQLTSGSATVVIQNQNQTISWTITAVDLDGDGIVETDASQVTVTLAGRTLETILIDTAERVTKI